MPAARYLPPEGIGPWCRIHPVQMRDLGGAPDARRPRQDPAPRWVTGYTPYGGEYTVFTSHPLPATILSSDGYKFSAVIDKDQTDEEGEPLINRFRRKMPAYRIVEFIDEPPRKLCSLGNLLLPDGTCDSSGECGCKMQEDWF